MIVVADTSVLLNLCRVAQIAVELGLRAIGIRLVSYGKKVGKAALARY